MSLNTKTANTILMGTKIIRSRIAGILPKVQKNMVTIDVTTPKTVTELVNSDCPPSNCMFSEFKFVSVCPNA